jgi:hypothetical protein
MVHRELERAKEAGRNINVEKTKAMVQSRRPRGRDTMTAKEQDIKVVRKFKYPGTVLNDTNDGKEDIRVRILAANKHTVM